MFIEDEVVQGRGLGVLAEEDFGAMAVGLLKYIYTDQERQAHIYRYETS